MMRWRVKDDTPVGCCPQGGKVQHGNLVALSFNMAGLGVFYQIAASADALLGTSDPAGS